MKILEIENKQRIKFGVVWSIFLIWILRKTKYTLIVGSVNNINK